MMKSPGNIIIYSKLLMTAVFWGGTFIAARVVMRDVGAFPAAFLRFAMASLFLVFFTWRIEKGLPRLKRKQIIPVILLGMQIFLYNVFFFKALKIISAGRAAVIVALNPIVIGMLSSLFFKEKLTAAKIVGLVVSVTGAVVVISRGSLAELAGGGFGSGELYVCFAVMGWVFYSLLGKATMTELSPLVTVTYSSLVGTAALAVPAGFAGVFGNMSGYGGVEWLSIFYLGFFGTVVGFVWFYEGIDKIGATRASQFINFVPISAVLLALVVLKEPITISLSVGTVLVCAGVCLSNIPARK